VLDARNDRSRLRRLTSVHADGPDTQGEQIPADLGPAWA
jgi:hypothetical protein